jgi:hypothetical protein
MIHTQTTKVCHARATAATNLFNKVYSIRKHCMSNLVPCVLEDMSPYVVQYKYYGSLLLTM